MTYRARKPTSESILPSGSNASDLNHPIIAIPTASVPPPPPHTNLTSTTQHQRRSSVHDIGSSRPPSSLSQSSGYGSGSIGKIGVGHARAGSNMKAKPPHRVEALVADGRKEEPRVGSLAIDEGNGMSGKLGKGDEGFEMEKRWLQDVAMSTPSLSGEAKTSASGIKDATQKQIQTVPVTSTSSIVLQTCRPLPEDILSLDEEDTGCRYCGVSYLLMSKYEKLVKHVSRVEEEMAGLKHLETEHPILASRIKELEGMHASEKEGKEKLEEEYTTLKEENGKTETSAQNSVWMEQGLKSQLRLLARKLLDTVDTLKGVRGELEDVKKGVKSSANLSSRLHLHLIPRVIHPTVQRLIASQTEPVINRLQEQISELKEDLEHSEQTRCRLSDELDEARRSFEIHLEEMRSEWEGRVAEVEGRWKEGEKTLSDLRGENAKLEAAERELRHRLKEEKERRDIDALHLRTRQLELENGLKERETRISDLQSKLEEERRSHASTESETIATINKSLAQKDITIHQLQTSIKEHQKRIEAMETDRRKTVEAHQSRVSQLQEKYREMLEKAGSSQADSVREEMTKSFQKEREEAVKSMKAMFQQQLDSVRNTLQSQLDAARLSRDTAWNDSKKKIAAVEDEWNGRVKRANAELEGLKAVTPAQSISADMAAEISRRDAEIQFLRETVRIECEERMGLLAMLDGIRRGVPNPGQKRDGEKRMVKKKDTLNEFAKGSREGGAERDRDQEQEQEDPELDLYKSMMANAELKKAQKLKNAKIANSRAKVMTPLARLCRKNGLSAGIIAAIVVAIIILIAFCIGFSHWKKQQRAKAMAVTSVANVQYVSTAAPGGIVGVPDPGFDPKYGQLPQYQVSIDPSYTSNVYNGAYVAGPSGAPGAPGAAPAYAPVAAPVYSAGPVAAPAAPIYGATTEPIPPQTYVAQPVPHPYEEQPPQGYVSQQVPPPQGPPPTHH
ncbi:hypothetical protein HDU97_003205 [Phlyctochytrium planicorne]|nr:hypothetical protein HDU97_003205 [Phlyctochytrium planicorne]